MLRRSGSICRRVCPLPVGVLLIGHVPFVWEGFTDLVALTKEYAFAAGVPYRYRDKWGAWTR